MCSSCNTNYPTGLTRHRLHVDSPPMLCSVLLNRSVPACSCDNVCMWTWAAHAQVTLLREHCQGPNKMMFVLPTGGFDPRRHSSREVRRHRDSILLFITAPH